MNLLFGRAGFCGWLIDDRNMLISDIENDSFTLARSLIVGYPCLSARGQNAQWVELT